MFHVLVEPSIIKSPLCCYNNHQSSSCFWVFWVVQPHGHQSEVTCGADVGQGLGIPKSLRLRPGPIRFFHSVLTNHVFMELTLCKGELSYWNKVELLNSSEEDPSSYNIHRHSRQFLAINYMATFWGSTVQVSINLYQHCVNLFHLLFLLQMAMFSENNYLLITYIEEY